MMRSINKITPTIGGKIVKAARPKAGINAINICSPPYADDEMQSEERTPNAYFLFNL